jgi:spore coat-associated protein N
MTRTILALLLVAGVMAGFASAGSAIFTSTASVDANTFTTGTVIISTSPATALVTFSNMAPGDTVTAPITVTNGGTLSLRYAITDTATNADTKGLGAQLQLTIKSGLTVGNCTNAGFTSGGTTINNSGVTQLGVLPAGTAQKVVGDPTQGSQTGDRTLASGSEILCFHVLLPTTTDNTYQNASTTATFTFDAEQTANNP